MCSVPRLVRKLISVAQFFVPPAAAFAITGADPLNPATLGNEPWVMNLGLDGGMQISAEWLALQLAAPAAPVLHDNDGWVDFADAGGSYYYSRTRMPTQGDDHD